MSESDVVTPRWPAPARVHAWVTTRALGNMGSEGRPRVAAFLPTEPIWLKQVHGTSVVHADGLGIPVGNEPAPEGDASFARTTGTVCAVMAADCMPVLLTDEAGSVVGAAHAGWRGLCSGVIEATVAAMGTRPENTLAWLGPAIGLGVYEVGEEVRDAFLKRDAAAGRAFVAKRPGHWLLDLYAVARQRLGNLGVTKVYGGGFCTYTESARFYSYRRDKTTDRMAALIWLT